MATVIRARAGQRTPAETVPMGCGQPFLVGHRPPALLSAATASEGSHIFEHLIIYGSELVRGAYLVLQTRR